jgi:DNA-binding response OmpR family regulator
MKEQTLGAQADSSANPSAQRWRVLVVETHEDTRAMLERLLVAASHRVHTATTCARARALAASLAEPLDVAVAEVKLPDGDGVTLLVDLRERYGCRTIAFTVPGSAEDGGRCDAAGIDRHMVKPQGMAALRAMVAALGAGDATN